MTWYRQASQPASVRHVPETLKNLPLASLTPQPVNGRYYSKISFLIIVKFLISSRFARCLKPKLITLPSGAGGSHFAKAYKRNRPQLNRYGLFCMYLFDKSIFRQFFRQKNSFGNDRQKERPRSGQRIDYATRFSADSTSPCLVRVARVELTAS